MNNSKHKLPRTPDEVVILVLSACAFMGIVPFGIYRVASGEPGIAAIDLLAGGFCAALFVYVLRTGRTGFAKIVLSAAFLLTANLTVIVKGSSQLYWWFPVICGLFFLLPHRTAAIAIVIGLMPTVYVVGPTMEPLVLATVGIALLATNMFAYTFAAKTFEQRQRLEMLVTQDALTEVGNRRALEEALERCIQLSRRHQHPNPVSLLLMDLDHFKQINDSYGHDMGDRVLIGFCRMVEERARKSDRLFRLGGEEFVLLLEGAGLSSALQIAEQLREAFASSELVPGIGMTMSIGVAEYQNDSDYDEWLKRADAAMYMAKRQGRNRVYGAPSGGVQVEE